MKNCIYLILISCLIACASNSKTQEINFDGSDIQEVQISLMKLDDLPSSTIIKSVTETLKNNKTTKEISPV